MSDDRYRWECDCGAVLVADTASEIGRKYQEHMSVEESP